MVKEFFVNELGVLSAMVEVYHNKAIMVDYERKEMTINELSNWVEEIEQKNWKRLPYTT